MVDHRDQSAYPRLDGCIWTKVQVYAAANRFDLADAPFEGVDAADIAQFRRLRSTRCPALTIFSRAFTLLCCRLYFHLPSLNLNLASHPLKHGLHSVIQAVVHRDAPIPSPSPSSPPRHCSPPAGIFPLPTLSPCILPLEATTLFVNLFSALITSASTPCGLGSGVTRHGIGAATISLVTTHPV